MTRRHLAAAVALVLAGATPGNAWLMQKAAVCPNGLGDLGTSYTFYWGVRAYTAAYASAGGRAFNVVRSSDSVTCDFVYDGSGNLFNLKTASCSNSGASNNQAPATFCNATTCKPVTLYNQTGGTACSGSACDFAQTTDANRFTLDFACGKTPFCILVASGKSMSTPSYAIPSATQTLNVVGSRPSGTAGSGIFFQNGVTNTNDIRATASGNSWSININGGVTTNTAGTSGAFHAAVGTIAGASSAITVDTTTATVSRAGNANAAAMQIIGSTSSIEWLEASYLASVGQDATARANVISQQRACWAF